MEKTRVIVKVSPGKSKGGTIVAKKRIAIKKAKNTQGRPIFQTRAQLLVRMNGNGRK